MTVNTQHRAAGRLSRLIAGLLMATAFSATSAASPVAAQLRFNEAREMMGSADADEVQMGLEAMGDLGRRATAPLIARIEAGLPDALLLSAVASLAFLERREAADTLIALARHRNADVRRMAIDGLAKLSPPRVSAVFATALSDGDPRVRASAALALGAVGAVDQVDVLFVALDHRVLEAAQAIGQLIDADGLARYLSYLGRLSLDALAPGLQEVLARRNMPTAAKLQIVAALEEMATPEVQQFLQDLADSLAPGELRDSAAGAAGRIAL